MDRRETRWKGWDELECGREAAGQAVEEAAGAGGLACWIAAAQLFGGLQGVGVWLPWVAATPPRCGGGAEGEAEVLGRWRRSEAVDRP